MTNVQYTYQLHGLLFSNNNLYTFVSEQAIKPCWQEKWYAVSEASLVRTDCLILLHISDLSTQMFINLCVFFKKKKKKKKDIQPMEETGNIKETCWSGGYYILTVDIRRILATKSRILPITF